MIICSIDIGKNGGASLININKKDINIQLLDTQEIVNVLESFKNAFIVMEKIFVSQKMNPQAPIAFGMNKQKAIQAINNCLYFDVHPRSWQKYYYSSLKNDNKSKFKTIRECYDKTIKITNAEVEGRENDGKRASVLIGLYGTYYLLTDAIRNSKLQIKHYKFLEEHTQSLVKIKGRLHKMLISKLEGK